MIQFHVECNECGQGYDQGVDLEYERQPVICGACGSKDIVVSEEEENPREKGDDDGVEYADPRDYREGWE